MDANEYPRTRGDRWQDHATCAVEKIPLAVFYPPPGAINKEARAACQRCPVRHECLEDDLSTYHPYGIFSGFRAGLTANERQKLRAKRGNRTNRASPTPAACGNDGGYKRHRRLGEDVCDACREAHRIVNAKWRDARRGVAS